MKQKLSNVLGIITAFSLALLVMLGLITLAAIFGSICYHLVGIVCSLPSFLWYGILGCIATFITSLLLRYYLDSLD